MKKQIFIPVVLGGLVSLSAQAQDRSPREGDQRQNIREALIKKFDKNGDGKLDEKERPSREQLQEFFRAQLGGGRNPSGRPGEGRPSGRPGEGRPSGRPGEGRPGGRPGEGRPGGRPGEGRPGGADREKIRAAFMKKYDKNGDGRLDEKERPSREEAMEFFRAQGGGGRPGGGEGRPGGRPGEGRPGEGRPGGRPGEGRPGEGRPGGRGGEGGRGGFGGFRPAMSPVLSAIDKNRDGVITAEEMKNAAKALAALDKNKDGKLDREELRPQFNRGGSGRPGGDRPDFRRPGGDRPEGQRRPGGERREGDRPRPKRSDA